MSPVSAAERRKHWQNVLDRQAASGKPISVSAPKKTSQFRPSICGAKSYRTTKRRPISSCPSRSYRLAANSPARRSKSFNS